MKFKLSLLFLILLSFLSSQTTDVCNQNLLNSYNLKGLATPSSTVVLAMCASVTQSCCAVED